MIYALVGFICAVVGAIIGFVFAAVLAVGGHSDDLQEAYHQGFVEGRNSVLKDVNNLYDKYKDMANEHNNIRC